MTAVLNFDRCVVGGVVVAGVVVDVGRIFKRQDAGVGLGWTEQEINGSPLNPDGQLHAIV